MYFVLLVLLYLTPLLGYLIASQCGNEARQGKRIFSYLIPFLAVLALLWVAFVVSGYVLLVGLVLVVPLLRTRYAWSSLAGLVYGLSGMVLYEVSVLLFLFGLVVGTMQHAQKRRWKDLFMLHLPFLVLGLAAWVGIAIFI